MIAVSANQMQRVDEIAVRKYGILLVQMMELAGFHLASLIKQKMGGSVVDKRIVILAGKGNNGGGGLVAARFLSNWEGIIEVILSQEEVMNDTVKKRLLTRTHARVYPSIFPGFEKPGDIGLGWYLFMWGLFTCLMFISTLKKPKALQFVFLSLTILFWLLALSHFVGSTTEMGQLIRKIAGYEGIICGLSAIYLAMAEVINETYGKTILPVGRSTIK